MILFVGPLPPPVHGFSWVNQQVLALLMKRSDALVFNRSPSFNSNLNLINIFFLFYSLFQILRFLFALLFRNPTSVYLGWSGGTGMVIDSCFLLLARIFRVPVYVHHHAFSYLNSPSKLTLNCMSGLRQCYNIVLCSHMASKLSFIYSIPIERITVLSNAAFLLPEPNFEKVESCNLRVGFLSNITVEKGIFDFFDLAERVLDSGSSVNFVIAGPVDVGIKELFFKRLEELENVTHLGAVYGDSKDLFYRSLDVLAFPTRYANEAEPVTIHEAFRAGVPVIANYRGCIATMIDKFSGLCVAQEGSFVDEASILLKHWLAHPEELERHRLGARQRFLALQSENSQRLDWMISRIAGGAPLSEVP